MRAIAAVLLLLTACSAPTVTPTSTPTAVVTPTSTAPPLGSPAASTTQGSLLVMAAGDIACDPADPDFNAGAGTSAHCRQRDTASLLDGADLVVALGDNQYQCGGLAAYQAVFDRSWGRILARIRPAIGNHEYKSNGAPKPFGTNCDETHAAAGYYGYFGAAAPAGAYSFDAGGWHFATVDTTCNPARCAAQAGWLGRDLANHPAICSIVFYHHPRWTSGFEGNHPQGDIFWRVAAAAGVEIILNGHDHDYERFAPMDARGKRSATGVREFVVGTGGYGLIPFRAIQPNSVVRNSATFGVLRLTLHAASYDWRFLPVAGESFTDGGTGSCH